MELTGYYLILFLILFPLLMSGVFLVFPNNRLRDMAVTIVSAIIIVATILVTVISIGSGAVLHYMDVGIVNLIMLGSEILMTIGLLYLTIKYRKVLATIFLIAQAVIIIYAESLIIGAHPGGADLFLDEFSLIMALIIGIIGSLICVYSVGYMRDYHEHHTEIKDRRQGFFCLLFLFLSAMFGIVFSNNLLWLFFFWEITTLCSFLLIGYAWDEEARNNAFWALTLNVLGGVAFSLAFVVIMITSPDGNMLFLNELISSAPLLAMMPVALIGFSGLTKAAQMPFSSWLIGAMIAPTPVSALLHSSTMVKAGVYVFVRFAPVLEGSVVGIMFSLVGAITFLAGSAIAVSQSNAKKVLAYSTIANLGLVIACASVGLPEAVLAAVLLIVFHAVAKSLLFLSVGAVEHKVHSRDIEDMDGLISSMPRMSALMLVGIAGMFLAPFGMLISKWAAIEAFAQTDMGVVLVSIIAFGSAVTIFFWTKWMGKLIAVSGEIKENLEKKVSRTEWTALYILAALVVICCFILPFISSTFIGPFLEFSLGKTVMMGQENIVIMILLLVLILIMPLSVLQFKKSFHQIPRYMGGRPVPDTVSFMGSMGLVRDVELSNYYVENWFGENRLSIYGVFLCSLLIIAIFTYMVIGGII